MCCTILYLFMLSLHIGRVAETGCWTLPAEGGSHSAFLHLGSVAISNFRLDRCDQFRSATSGFTAPRFLTALRRIDWKPHGNTKKIALKLNTIEHAGFNSLNAMINTTGNYGFIGALAENCCMIAQYATINLRQASPSAFGRAQIRSSYIKLVCLDVFFTRLVYCKKWSDMEIVWSLSLQAEVFWTLWRICPWWTIAFGLCWE